MFEQFKKLFNSTDFDFMNVFEYDRFLFPFIQNVDCLKYAMSFRKPDLKMCFLNAFYNQYKETCEYLMDKVNPGLLTNTSVKKIIIDKTIKINGYSLNFNPGLHDITGISYRDRLYYLQNYIIIVDYNFINRQYHGVESYRFSDYSCHKNHLNLMFEFCEKLELDLSFLKWIVRHCSKYFKFEDIPKKLRRYVWHRRDELNLCTVFESILSDTSLTNDPMFEINCLSKIVPQYIFYL